MAIFLDNILKAIHNSVIEAQKISEQQHMRAIGRYFNLDKEKMKDDGVDIDHLGMPKTIDIKLPFFKENKLEYKDVDIPLIALNPPSSMKIKNMKVAFEAKLTGVADKKDNSTKKGLPFMKNNKDDASTTSSDDETTKGPIQLDLNPSDKSAGMAKIEIEFMNDDVPETFARINNHIVKSFPF